MTTTPVSRPDLIGRAFSDVIASMVQFRAGFREESSPIQVWPHHFDLSMLWLPGEKIDGQDPADEEYSDKQMNFGFVLGDDSIPEPYFLRDGVPIGGRCVRCRPARRYGMADRTVCGRGVVLQDPFADEQPVVVPA